MRPKPPPRLVLEASGGDCRDPDPYEKFTFAQLSKELDKFPATKRALAKEIKKRSLNKLKEFVCSIHYNLSLVNYYHNAYGLIPFKEDDGTSIMMHAPLSKVEAKCVAPRRTGPITKKQMFMVDQLSARRLENEEEEGEPETLRPVARATDRAQ
eukprot:jgi/Mesvir1/7987/Mv20127-RA.1